MIYNYEENILIIYGKNYQQKKYQCLIDIKFLI